MLSVIKAAFDRVKLISRDEALKKVKGKCDENKDRVVVPFDHNPRLMPPCKIMKKHHNTMTIKNPSLKQAFKAEPMPCSFTQPFLHNGCAVLLGFYEVHDTYKHSKTHKY